MKVLPTICENNKKIYLPTLHYHYSKIRPAASDAGATETETFDRKETPTKTFLRFYENKIEFLYTYIV